MMRSETSKRRKEIEKILAEEEISQEELTHFFELLYSMLKLWKGNERRKRKEKKRLLGKILERVSDETLFAFARDQINREVTGARKKLFCEMLSEYSSYIQALSRRTEELSTLLGDFCGKVYQTLFKINLRENIDERMRATSLTLVSLLGRRLSIILEGVISGEIAEGKVAASVLEEEVGRNESLKEYCKEIAKQLSVSSSTLYATELFNEGLRKKESFVSKEFSNEVISLLSRGEGLSTSTGALLIIYSLLCSKNLDVKRFKELIISEFNRKNFLPLVSAFTFSTIKSHSQKGWGKNLNLRVYLRDNLDALLKFSGKDGLMIDESLEKGKLDWIRALVWRKIFEEMKGEIWEDALSEFTEQLGKLVPDSPLQIVKALNSLNPPNLSETIIQKVLTILANALSASSRTEVSHLVAQVIRNLTFSSSISDLSGAISSLKGKKAIITLLLEGSGEVINEVSRLFNLSSTSWWLVKSSSEEKIHLKEETRRNLERKVQNILGEDAREVLTSLLGETQ